MDKYLSKETRSSIFKLGVYQIIGGAIGLLLVLWTIINTQDVNLLTVFLFLLMLSFFSYSVYCGVLCTTAREGCLTHSLINQALQVASVAAVGCAYQYAAGLYLNMGVNLSEGFHLDFGMGFSSLNLKINTAPETLKADVNLVAIGLLVWIDQTIRIVTIEKQLQEIKELGQELQPLEQ